jgi:hypothetical protein
VVLLRDVGERQEMGEGAGDRNGRIDRKRPEKIRKFVQRGTVTGAAGLR